MIDPTTRSIDPPPSRALEALLYACIASFSVALGSTLYLIAGVDGAIALLAAVSSMSTLAALFALLQRTAVTRSMNAEIADLKSELATLRSPVARARPVPVPAPAAVQREPAASGSAEPEATDVPAVDDREATLAEKVTDALAQGDHAAGERPLSTAPPWALRPGATRDPNLDHQGSGTPLVSGPLPTIAADASFGAFAGRRFGEAHSAATPAPLGGLHIPASDGAPRVMARPEADEWPKAAPAVPTAPLDLNTMQNLIEQLAGQLKPRETIVPASAEQAAKPGLFERTPELAAATATRGASSAPYGHLALIAEALAARRLDVCLEPILGLADRRARHFELSVRLIGEAGETYVEAEFADSAAGTGLLARLDAEKLTRAADVLERLRSRGSKASLFSGIAGESLTDENFAGTFADILAAEEGQATRLVLTFVQAEARNFTEAHWRTISAMSRIGLRFALADVTDLDMDFARLEKHGFAFIKLDANVFLDGLPAPEGHIPAVDICRHLASLGLGLIVGGIVEERELAKILGFGALLGQGALFGGPRSVELERERRAA